MALLVSFFRNYFGMRHYILHSRHNPRECSRRLGARTIDPLGRSTGTFVGWVCDDGFRLRKAVYSKHGAPMFFGTVQAWGVFLEDRHGTEIRLDIGTRPSELVLTVGIGLAVWGAVLAYTLVNGMYEFTRGWLWVAAVPGGFLLLLILLTDEPAFLHSEIARALRARSRSVTAVRSARGAGGSRSKRSRRPRPT